MRCGWTQEVAGSTSLNSLICISPHLRLMTAQEIKISATNDSDTSSSCQDASRLPFLLSSVRPASLSATRQAPVLGPTARTSKAVVQPGTRGLEGRCKCFFPRARRPAGPCLSKHATLKGNWGLFMLHVTHQPLLEESERKWGERSAGWLDWCGGWWLGEKESRWCGSHLEKAKCSRMFSWHLLLADCHLVSWHTQKEKQTSNLRPLYATMVEISSTSLFQGQRNTKCWPLRQEPSLLSNSWRSGNLILNRAFFLPVASCWLLLVLEAEGQFWY